MFCSTLRRRASFKALVPTLTANPGLNLRENSLNTHDLAIPLPRQGRADTARTLRVLLLCPSSTSPDAFSATLDRVQHFTALNGGLDSIIVFLLDTAGDSPPEQPTTLHAYSHLSTSLLADPNIASIPLIPLASLTSFDAVLKSYISSNSAARAAQMVQAKRPDTFNTALDLVPWCVARENTKPLDNTVPLDANQVNLLTDLFGSLREFAEAAVGNENDRRVKEKVEEMKSLLGAGVAQDILDFWRDEWYAD
ncbi:hypothetical protein MPH_00355 [Macrophomina phaseolina MS6]|uniref:Uncharacterized protein n=1 Tax=Macrophomina phaseolina (strain MS6) TaxID=1126212 RepID=K2S5S2_MACPH|nr:hypothetical protein MPH_00355 [Macrophomina phaseolina MS6]